MDRRHTHSVTLPGEQPVKYKPQEMLETAYLESNIGVNSQLEHDNNNNTEKVQSLFPIGYIQPQHLISMHGSQSLPKYIQEGGATQLSVPEVQHFNIIQRGNLTTPRRVTRTRQERTVEVGRMVNSNMISPSMNWSHPRHPPPHRYKTRSSQPATSSPSGGTCWLNLICLLAQLLLHALLAVLLYWLLEYRLDLTVDWMGGDVKLMWSLHPLMMVFGSVYCVGQGMLMYTCSSCCLPCCSTLFHVLFPLVSLPCLVVGLFSAWDLDSITSSHLVTMHSWCGAITVLLILSQIIFGLFNFAFIQCYKAEGDGYKSSITTLHKSFGVTIFLLAVASAISGVTQTAQQSYSRVNDSSSQPQNSSLSGFEIYHGLTEEGLVLNILGVLMILLSVLIPLILACTKRSQ